jgi:transposase-like protein
MDEETLRKMAIEQYLQGKEPVLIYKELGRTKPWFFKWLNRFQSGNKDWFQDHSRAPHTTPHETLPNLIALVKKLRIQREENPYAQIGVSAIKWECAKLGITPPPDRTINRILNRADLLKKNSVPAQRGRIPLFPGTVGMQQHPSSRPPRPPVHQKRRTLLFLPYHRSLQPSGLYSIPAPQRRWNHCPKPDSLLENHGDPRLSPTRQRIGLPGQQPASPVFWDRLAPLPFPGDRSRLHSHRRTLAQWNRGEFQ